MKTIIAVETKDDFSLELVNKLYEFLAENNIEAEISRDFAGDSAEMVKSFFYYE